MIQSASEIESLIKASSQHQHHGRRRHHQYELKIFIIGLRLKIMVHKKRIIPLHFPFINLKNARLLSIVLPEYTHEMSLLTI